MKSISDELWQRIVEILCTTCNLDRENIRPESEFVSDLGIDSPKIIDFMMSLEDAFDISIDENDIIGMSTVGDISEIVEIKIKSGELGNV